MSNKALKSPRRLWRPGTEPGSSYRTLDLNFKYFKPKDIYIGLKYIRGYVSVVWSEIFRKMIEEGNCKQLGSYCSATYLE